jgi:hypothetical protein
MGFGNRTIAPRAALLLETGKRSEREDLLRASCATPFGPSVHVVQLF